MRKVKSTWDLALGNLKEVTYIRPRYESCQYCGRMFVKAEGKKAQKYCTPECGSSMRRILLSRRNSK